MTKTRKEQSEKRDESRDAKKTEKHENKVYMTLRQRGNRREKSEDIGKKGNIGSKK